VHVCKFGVQSAAALHPGLFQHEADDASGPSLLFRHCSRHPYTLYTAMIDLERRLS
jgi:hypothetical protein